MTELSDRHKRFVDEYVKDTNAAAAARRAGFSARSAGQLMKVGAIRAEIERRQEAIAVATQITIASLCEEAEAARCLAQSDGNPAAMVAAITLKAKLTGKLTSENNEDVTRQEEAERRAQQRGEHRKAGRLLADAAESLGLPRDATPAMIVGSVAQVAIATPQVFELLRASQEEAANAG